MSERAASLVKALRVEVPDCVAAGVIDMSTGMLLSVETVDSHPPEVLDMLAAATLDLFQGRNVVMIEGIFEDGAGSSATGTTSRRAGRLRHREQHHCQPMPAYECFPVTKMLIP
ncbi:hypothetical protein GCM10010430_69280 [Kitasatospora cystarginea]|uniref:Roadblock/LAMTOR2 domain-containing protein n=1 Tax=Kitasatospora cystarginea TaxID=58350 RepID=A0ABP5RTC2_9ACTN